jgi:hypothetical protein
MEDVIAMVVALSICISCLVSLYSVYTASRCGVMSQSSAECRRTVFA